MHAYNHSDNHTALYDTGAFRVTRKGGGGRLRGRRILRKIYPFFVKSLTKCPQKKGGGRRTVKPLSFRLCIHTHICSSFPSLILFIYLSNIILIYTLSISLLVPLTLCVYLSHSLSLFLTLPHSLNHERFSLEVRRDRERCRRHVDRL